MELGTHNFLCNYEHRHEGSIKLRSNLVWPYFLITPLLHSMIAQQF